MIPLTPKWLLLILAITALAGSATPAFGKTVHSKPWRCHISEHGTNPEWTACMGREVQSQEGRLNRAWQTVLPLLPEKSKADLLVEERAWIAYKETSCSMWANGDWGREGVVLSWGSCRSAVVGARADALEDLAAELKALPVR